MLDAEKEIVAAAARRLGREGWVSGTFGNASMRCGDRLVVTATGTRLEHLTGEQVVIVELDGTVVDGDLEPTSELPLHLGAYRRYEIGAIVHTHAPFATALSTILPELPVIHHGMLSLGGAVRVAAYATPGTQRLADLVLDALDGRTAALMANHGTTAVGGDLDEAVETTRQLEWFAELYSREELSRRDNGLVAALRR
jgi:L-fuculose-phosphate aldolase